MSGDICNKIKDGLNGKGGITWSILKYALILSFLAGTISISVSAIPKMQTQIANNTTEILLLKQELKHLPKLVAAEVLKEIRR